MVEFVKQSRRRLVVEMTETAAYPLLEHPGVAPFRQHLNIVVAFKHQCVASTQHFCDVPRDAACVGKNAEFVVSIGKHKLHRLTRIMRDRKRMDLQLADSERTMAVDHSKAGWSTAIAGHGYKRSMRQNDFEIMASRTLENACAVIAMFVSKQNGGNVTQL